MCLSDGRDVAGGDDVVGGYAVFQSAKWLAGAGVTGTGGGCGVEEEGCVV